MLKVNFKKMTMISLATMGIMLSFGLFSSLRATAATPQEQVCAGLGAVDGGSGCGDSAGSSSLSNTVASVINILSVVVGTVAVIMVVIGGLKYVSSQGDSSGIAGAKNTIIYALVGLIIVALAQVMVHFVIARVATNRESVQTGGNNNGPR